MKYKKSLIINILSYMVVYHIVFEFFMTFLYSAVFYDKEDDKKIFTPFGRVFRKLLLNEKNIELLKVGDFYIIIFNLLISAILIYIVNKWYGKENVIKTMARLYGAFIILNAILIVYTFIDNRMGIFFIYIFYFLLPMSIMTILIIPTFWITQKLFTKNGNN